MPSAKKILKRKINKPFIEGHKPLPYSKSFERKVDDWLGNPMDKAYIAGEEAAPMGDDPVDNFRHPMAGRYTSEAIQDRTGNIPVISNALGYIGSNYLGAGHELKTMFNDNRSWPVKLREAGEDIFNNGVGSFVGSLPMNSNSKTNILKNASDNNLLPDGYGDADMYFKKEFNNGGYMKKLKYNKKGTYPTYEFPPMAFGGWLDQLPQQYGNGGDLPPMEVDSGLPKYGKKRVLNLKDYTKQNTTSNILPVVQNPFSRENKVNLHFPENHGEEHRRLEVNPYFGGVNVEPDVNVYYGGVNADLNLLNKNNNKLDLRGKLGTDVVTYPGGSHVGVHPSVGLSYSRKFVEGGWLDELPNQYGNGGNIDGVEPPPLVFDKNDPYGQMRYQAYNDSLNLYNSTLRDIKEFGKEIGREPFTRSWEGPYEKSPGVWETKTYYDNSKIAPQYLALRSHKGTKRLNQVVNGTKVDSFDDANAVLTPVYKKPTTPIQLIDERQPYSPIQTNQLNTVQLPISNIPLQQMPTIGIGEPNFEGNNAYWKKQDNQLIRQNNEYSNNRNLPISNKPGDRFHQEPSWMVGDDRYYERDGEAYLVPQPKGGWKNKQTLDASSGKWKSSIVKKANGGWLDNL